MYFPSPLMGEGQGEGGKSSVDCFGDSNKRGDMALIMWTSAASTEPIRDKVRLVSLPIQHRS